MTEDLHGTLHEKLAEILRQETALAEERERLLRSARAMMSNRDYMGEYFMAVLTGSESSGYSYHIMQISPVLYLAKTESRELAIQLVNRLDISGDEPVEIGS